METAHSTLPIEKIKELKALIEADWETQVRRKMPASATQSSSLLRNSLPHFLDHVFKVLQSQDSRLAETEIQFFSKLHGFERAQLKGYSLVNLLKEFSILRDVLNLNLENKRYYSHSERALVDKIIDTALSSAAVEFASVHTTEMKESLDDAETSNADLSHFASIAAHDLKSPLATIMGFADMLKQEFRAKLGSDGLDYLDRILSAGTRMRILMDAILDYAKLDSTERNFEFVSGQFLVQSALENLQERITACGAQIVVRPLPQVYCDPPLIAQLFQNLIANSLKFQSLRPSVIEIEAKSDSHCWTFSIRDNGIGFDPSQSLAIFNLYKKLNSDAQYSGSGIGLATCKRIIELHKGRIWAESVPGQGSTFYFSIPK